MVQIIVLLVTRLIQIVSLVQALSVHCVILAFIMILLRLANHVESLCMLVFCAILLPIVFIVLQAIIEVGAIANHVLLVVRHVYLPQTAVPALLVIITHLIHVPDAVEIVLPALVLHHVYHV